MATLGCYISQQTNTIFEEKEGDTTIYIVGVEKLENYPLLEAHNQSLNGPLFDT
jgi:hypothetical protein